MSRLAFLLAAFSWNYGFGMTYVVVPLYAHAQGLSAAEIGTLFSLPVFGQVSVGLVGGAYTDRLGARRVMLAATGLMVLAGLSFLAAHGFWALVAAQLVIVLSRATFWPATWSSASELPGTRGVQLGRLNAINQFGQIIGTASSGFVLAAAGFTAAFVMLAAVGLGASVLVLASPVATRRRTARGHPFTHFGALLRQPTVYYVVVCAYLSALPFSLAMSFYPLLLLHYGFGADASGMLLALRSLGSIGAALLAARSVKTGPRSLWPVYAGTAVALAIGGLPLWPVTPIVALLLLLVGIGSGTMTLYFQITVSEVSSVEQRGSAMSLGGLGWGVSHLTTPVVVGLLAERYGIVTGFYVLGVLALLVSGTLALLRGWAFSGSRLAAS